MELRRCRSCGWNPTTDLRPGEVCGPITVTECPRCGSRLSILNMPIAISPVEQQHHADLRAQSYELAKQRGHIRV